MNNSREVLARTLFVISIAILVALLATISLGIANEHDSEAANTTFEYDGLYFTITSSNPPQVKVIYHDGYEGDIVVPSYAEYNGTQYKVTRVGGWAFESDKITSVTLPDTITTIEDNAFNYCEKLTSVNIPDLVESIGDSVFSDCSSLTTINIPDSVTSIGYAAFKGCSSLTSVIISDSVESIGTYAFNGCSSLTTINIPDSVTTIGDSMFNGCSSLTTINIPNSVTTISYSAFNGCSSLTSVIIPDSVTTINQGAFENCSSLEEIVLGEKVSCIGYYCFGGCSNLERIYSLNETPPEIGPLIDDWNGSVIVPAKSISAYEEATRWSDWKGQYKSIVNITIPTWTSSITYDGTEHIVSTTSEYYAVSGDTAKTTVGEYAVTSCLIDVQAVWDDGTRENKIFNWEITPKELTVTANDNTITYGDAPSDNGRTITGFVNGETESVISGTVTYSYSYAQFGTVGNYTITPDVSGLTATNYTFSAANGTLEVSQKELTVTAVNNAITYGEAPSDNGRTITGFVNDETEAVISGAVTYTYTYTQFGDVGSYVITPVISGLSATNYTFSAVDGALTVSQKTLTISSATATDRAYDGTTSIVITGTLTGVVNSDAVSVSSMTGTSASKDAGTHDVIVSLTLTGAKAGNYTLTQPTGLTVTISTIELTVTAVNNTITYGEAPSDNGRTITGFVNDETEAVISGAVTYTYTYTQFGDVGSYVITPVISGLSATNYTFSAVDGALEVSQKTLTIESVAATGRAYDGTTNVALVGTLTGVVNSDAVSVSSMTGTIACKDAGAYDVNVNLALTGAKAGNYTLTQPIGLTVEISKVELTVTAVNNAITYGDAPSDNGRTITGFVNDETEDVITGAVTYTYTYTQFGDVGSYVITPVISGLSATNYTFSAVDGALTVSQRELTISSATATDRAYDGTTSIVITGTLTGVVNNDEVSVSSMTGTSASKDAGTHDVIVSLTLTGAKAGNYTLTQPTGLTVTISKVELTVTAENNTITYGEAPSDNGMTITGFVNGESESVISGAVTYTYTYTQFGDVGSYAITPVVSGLTATNYTFSAVDGSLTVSQRELTISSATVTNRAYNGSANVDLTGTLTGVVNNDEVSVSSMTGTSASKNAGTHDVTVSLTLTGAKAGNYTLTQPTGLTVTISKVELTVTAENNTITYGEAPSDNGRNVTGFVNGEDEGVITGEVTYTYTYAQFGDVGSYAITPVVSGLTATNYTFSAVDGALTVSQRELTISSATATDRAYDGTTSVVITGMITGVVNSDDVSVISMTGTSASKNAGTHDVTVSLTLTGAKAGNYTLTQPTGLIVTISKVELTVTAVDNTITYGEAPSDNGMTITGFVNGEDEGVITGEVTYTYTYTQYGTVGNYTITPVVSGLTATNYTFSAANGSLNVIQKDIDGAIVILGDALTYNGEEQTQSVSSVVIDGLTVTFGVYDNTATDAGNYTLTVNANGNFTGSVTQIFAIAPREITLVWGDIDDLVYNGEEKMPTVTIGNTVMGQTVTATIEPTDDDDNVNVGTFTFTVTGLDNTNYRLPSIVESKEYEIIAKTVIVSGITAEDKDCDGNADAILVFTAVVIDGMVDGDILTVSAVGVFEDAEVGEGKTVYIMGLTLDGISSDNYVLAAEGQQTTTTASIISTGVMYTVTFLREDGTVASESITVASDVNIAEPIIMLEENEVIDGWYNGNVLWNFADDSVTSDTTLVVKISVKSRTGEIVVYASDKTATDIELDGKDVSKATVITSNGIVVLDGLDTDENLMISIVRCSTSANQYDVRVTLGGEEYSGDIEITLFYDKTKGTPEVYYYPDTGDKVRYDCVCDEESQTVTFVTTHNSTYGIEYVVEPEPQPVPEPTSGGSNAGIFILIAILVSMVIVGVFTVVVFSRD